MATKGDINATVGIGIKTEAGALKGLNDQINTVIRQVQSTVTQALKETDKMSAANVAKLREFSKALNQTEQSIKILQRYGSGNRKLLDFLGSDEQLQKQARSIRNVQEYRRTLEQAGTTSDALKARINALDKAQLEAATKGKKSLDTQIAQQQRLRDALKEYEAVQRRIGSVSLKAGLLSNDSFGKLDTFINRLQAADNLVSSMSRDKRVFNFQAGLDQLKLATVQMEEQVKLLAQQDKAAGRLAEKTQQRAKDLLATTPGVQQAQINAAGRKGFVNNQYLGMNTEDFERRLSRATTLYSITKRQLQTEIDKGAGADTNRLESLMGRYRALQTIIGQTGRAYQSYTSTTIAEIGKMETRVSGLQSAYEKLSRAERKTLVDDIKRDISESERLLKQFDKQLGDVGQQANIAKPQRSKLAESVQGLLGDGGLALGSRVGIYALAASGIYGIINAAKDAGRFVVEFEDKLAQLQAISGSTNTQMEQLSRVILDVSKSSRFSAVEIAEATVQLAQAGFSAKDLGDSLGAITNFAAASGTSVKDSVDIITGAIGAFQLQASEAGRVTDIFTAALNRSRLSSQQIAQAIQYVGTTAFEQNISLEQMVATIGSVAQAGVRAGSTLGTGFRQFLVDLSNPTEKLKEQLKLLGLSMADIDIKTRGLPAVLDSLSKAGFGAAQAYEGLEVRAAAFYLAAKNNVDISERLMLAESQRGVAAEASARAMDSLNAQWIRFQNILAQIANESAPLDFLKDIVKYAADAAEGFRQAGINAKKMSDEAIEAARAGNELDFNQAMNVDVLELAKVRIEQALDGMTSKLREAGFEVSDWRDQWEAAHPVVVDTNEAMATAVANATDEVNNQTDKISSLEGELVRLITQQDSLKDNQIQTQAETSTLTSRFEGLASMLGNTANRYYDLIQAMQRYRVEELKILNQKLQLQESEQRTKLGADAKSMEQQRQGILGSAQLASLPAAQRQRIQRLLGSNLAANGGRNTQILSDIANNLGPGQSSLKEQLQRLVQQSFNVNIGAYDIGATRAARSQVQGLLNPDVIKVSNSVSNLTGSVNRLRSQGMEKTPAEREKLYSKTLQEVDQQLGYVNERLKDRNLDKDTRSALVSKQGELTSLKGQIVGATTATTSENKDAERARKAGEAQARRDAAAARRAQSQNERNNLTAAQSRLTASGKSLESFLGDDNVIGSGLSNVEKMFQESDKMLDEWIANRQNVLAAAVEKGDMNEQQIADMTKAANEEIAAKRRDIYGKQLAVVSQAFDDYISDQAHKLEEEARQAMQAPNRKVRLAEATESGLSNPLYNIPDYTRVIAGRQSDLARQAQRGAQIATNEQTILGNAATIDKLMSELETVRKFRGTEGEEIERDKRIIELNRTIDGLTRTNEELRLSTDELIATNNAINLKPKTFGEGLAQAAEGFRIQNNIGIGLDERMINGLGGAIDSVHASFQQFFTDVMTGAASVGQAFGSMAKAVVSALAEMAAKAVATQIFGLLLSFIPQSQNFSNLGPSTPIVRAQRTWNGGMIGGRTPQRLIGGGRVSQGLPTRDSTLVHAAEGEFMVRRSSVQSIGETLLNDMNNRGAAALKGIGDKNIVVPQSQLQSNVYVVLPEEKPTLGPADVLAVVSRDVLRGGATKQLIKQVAAGG